MISIRSRHSRQALAIQRSAIAFARGARTGVLMIRTCDRGEHGVERRGELSVPVPDQELKALGPIVKVHQQVPGLLDHPLLRGMCGDSGQVHAAGAVLDEEQHVQAPQEYGIDVEEARRQDRLRPGFKECPPGLPGSSGRGVDARVFEDLPHRRRGQLVPEPGQLTVNAAVSPAGLSLAISSTSTRTGFAALGRPGARRGQVQYRRTRWARQRRRVRGEMIRCSWPSCPRGSSGPARP